MHDKNEFKILFFIDFQAHFLVKWENYPNSQNSWEPEENFDADCREMFEELDKKMAHKFIGKNKKMWHEFKYIQMTCFFTFANHFLLLLLLGAKKVGDAVFYLLTYKDLWPNKEVPHAEALEKYPHVLKAFLESGIEMSPDPVVVSFAATETTNVIGDPIRITCNF